MTYRLRCADLKRKREEEGIMAYVLYFNLCCVFDITLGTVRYWISLDDKRGELGRVKENWSGLGIGSRLSEMFFCLRELNWAGNIRN